MFNILGSKEGLGPLKNACLYGFFTQLFTLNIQKNSVTGKDKYIS